MKWPEEKLGSFCATGSGGTPSRDRAAEFYGGRIPWVKSGELRESVVTQTGESLTEAGLANSSAKIIPPGALLVAMYGATVGRVGILGIEAATNQAVCHIIPRAGRADIRYLFHCLQAKLPVFLGRSVGGAQPNISQEIIRDTSVPLPPVEEQRRIAAILDKADALRHKRRVALEKLDSLSQSVFFDIFGDLRTNTKNWQYLPLGLVSGIQGGLQLTPHRKSLPLKVPYLRVANVMRNALKLDEIKILGVTEPELEKARLARGDLLFVEGHGNAGEIGRCAIWDGSIVNCVHQNHLIRSRVDQTAFTPEFVSAFFNSPVGRRQLLRAGKTTSGLNTISTSDVKRALVPHPPLDLQATFSAFCLLLTRVEDKYQSLTVASDMAFSSLQQRAFRGEL